MINLLFPILKSIRELFGYRNEIVENNYWLAKELEEKNMPPMSAQDIKKYVLKQNK